MLGEAQVTRDGTVTRIRSAPVRREYAFVVTLRERTSFEAHIPPAYYDTPRALLDRVNESVRGTMKFTYEESTRKCHLHILESGTSLKLSEHLAVMLGFRSQTWFDRDVTGSDDMSIEPPFHNILVYANIVEPTLVGPSKKKILKVLPFHYEKDKNVLTYTFHTVQYFKLSEFDIASVTILLSNEVGRQLPLLPKGRTSLTLHFKHVP